MNKDITIKDKSVVIDFTKDEPEIQIEGEPKKKIEGGNIRKLELKGKGVTRINF